MELLSLWLSKVAILMSTNKIFFMANWQKLSFNYHQIGRVKWIWYLLHMRAAKIQASLRIRVISPEPLLLAHTSSESKGTFRQKARSLAPLNGWACAVKSLSWWNARRHKFASHATNNLLICSLLLGFHWRQLSFCDDHKHSSGRTALLWYLLYPQLCYQEQENCEQHLYQRNHWWVVVN